MIISHPFSPQVNLKNEFYQVTIKFPKLIEFDGANYQWTKQTITIEIFVLTFVLTVGTNLL